MYQPVTEDGGPDIKEIPESEYTPRDHHKNTFPWDDCNLQAPAIDCSQFPEQKFGPARVHHNIVNVGEIIPIDVKGSCWPDY